MIEKHSDPRKQSIYLATPLLKELREMAQVERVSLSRIITDCIRIARLSKSKKPQGCLAYRSGPVKKDIEP